MPLSAASERTVGSLRVVIDRNLCVGFGDCVDEAPGVFRLDADDIAVFCREADGAVRDHVVKACEVCPVDALTARDLQGKQIAP